jgi:hypothetical protein
MSFILPSQFDENLLLLTSRMQLEMICALASFLDYMHQFFQKEIHMMWALMFDFRFKNVFILNNYVRIEKTIIPTTRYNSKTLMPFLCSIYQKVHPFTKHP